LIASVRACNPEGRFVGAGSEAGGKPFAPRLARVSAFAVGSPDCERTESHRLPEKMEELRPALRAVEQGSSQTGSPFRFSFSKIRPIPMPARLPTFLRRLFLQRGKLQSHRELEKKLGYRFVNLELLSRALTHRSYIHTPENEDMRANERLEFLGDSVLGMVTSRFLFEHFPDKSEGDLTKLKSTLVSEANLSQIAKSISLGQHLNLSEEEEKSGGRERNSIVSDAYEAVIGAVFLDGGLAPVERMIKNQILKRYLEITTDRAFHNYKGELLEYMQALGLGLPRYDLLEEKGPDHEKRFTIAASVKGRQLGRGTGKNKKEAEQGAARMALENIDSIFKDAKQESQDPPAD
jgi:ribonuclease-3